MTTYDASSFCPDSASTATSMASGEKTLSGVINYNIDKTEPFKIITEYAKEAGKKVGVISTVSLNHATPAAYYAKMPSRNDYYDIAVQGITGDTLDFIGGGNWNQPDGDGTQANLYDLARENGFNVVNTNEGIRAINANRYTYRPWYPTPTMTTPCSTKSTACAWKPKAPTPWPSPRSSKRPSPTWTTRTASS